MPVPLGGQNLLTQYLLLRFACNSIPKLKYSLLRKPCYIVSEIGIWTRGICMRMYAKPAVLSSFKATLYSKLMNREFSLNFKIGLEQ